MSRLKNWFVRSERIKDRHGGLIQYLKYLTANEHPNHKGRTTIKPLYGDVDAVIQGCSSEAIQLDLKNSQSKGGRPVNSYAQSFTFVLPGTVKQPTTEQWRLVFKDVAITLAQKLGIPADSLKGKAFANIHDQNNPHLNLVVSRVINGKYQRKLDQKATINTLKKSFTAATLKHCGLNIDTYMPEQSNLGKRQSNWQRQQEESQKQLKAATDAAKKLEEEIERAKLLGKYTAMLNNQIQKWMLAVQENDTEQENRQANRIDKSITSLNELNVDPGTAELIEALVSSVEKKAGRPITVKRKHKPWPNP
ncbi:hypothetical protein [Pseudomonas sp. Gutcm_11s]|uniref:hypothetical protein n=1 Tax=Pseudomonas sp. Gutcm_11s TaxID=3026088 RepID=UPI00235DDA3D|nr:hypothetical protein [Pseudomonas sp. Gutcm_11s]MDD0842374.1 hypothetical protein [Pseudomonas sp. Gutcm_11s]